MKNIINNFFKQKSNILLISGMIILIILIIIFIVPSFKHKKNYNDDNSNFLEEQLKKIGKQFYENYYYSNLSSEEYAKLANFSNNGIRIDITNLEVIISLDDSIKNQLEKDNCDFDQTKIVIYPKEPYGKQDYSVELELSCKNLK